MIAKRIRGAKVAPESTRLQEFRQKRDIFRARGASLISGVSVLPLPRTIGGEPRGLMRIGSQHALCAIGTAGIGVKSKEGDGRTPIGRFQIIGWRRRAEAWPVFRADSRPIRNFDGWCDDPAVFAYNRYVHLPFRARCETLTRSDGVYDALGFIDYNTRPRILGRGSAIFLHLAHEDYRPTAGCIALDRIAMRRLQKLWSNRLQISVGMASLPLRRPKIAEPTRTWVAPSWIASSKSPLIPIERQETPFSIANRRNKAK